MSVIAKGIPRGCQGLFTPVSLGYLLSVFNKNSTLKSHACVFLFLSMHLEGALLTQEEIPTQCKMTTQEWMTAQYETDV